jgi:hypothetical protein
MRASLRLARPLTISSDFGPAAYLIPLLGMVRARYQVDAPAPRLTIKAPLVPRPSTE